MNPIQATILETERLLLRRLTMDDLDALCALYRDPEVRRYFPDGTLTYEETKDELAWIIDVYYRQYGWGLWATIHKATNTFIGRCGLLPWTIEGRSEVEIAYLLDKAYWGQGLATEAARAIRDYGFEQLNLSRLICVIDREHHASQKVATNIGMRFEREIEDKYGTALLYAVSRPARSNEAFHTRV